MRRALPTILLLGAGCQQIFGLEAPSRVVDATVSGDGPLDGTVDGLPDAPVVLPTLVFITTVTSGVDTSMYTFNAVPTHTAATDRLLIVVAHGRNPNTGFGAASLMIDGATATKWIAANEADGAATTAVFTHPATAGTSATMVLSYTAGAGDRRVALGVWAAYGLASSTPQTTLAVSTASTNPAQAMIQIPTDGFAIAGVSMSAVVNGTTSTWSGVPEAYEQIVEDSSFSGGSNLVPSAGGPVDIVHSSTDTVTSHHMAIATFR